MSLVSQDQKNNSRWLYFYIAISGLGSLLMFFLVRGSLPIKGQAAEAYYQAIIETEQKLSYLDKKLLEAKYSQAKLNLDLVTNIESFTVGLEQLRNTPQFLVRSQREMIENQLETQELLLNDKLKLLQKLESSEDTLYQSCLYIPQLNNELLNSDRLFASDLSVNSQLISSLDNLLKNSIDYCQNRSAFKITEIEDNLKAVESLLEQTEFSKYKIIVTEFNNYGKNLIAHNNLDQAIFEQIDLEPVKSSQRKLEEIYHLAYQDQIKLISLYRLLLTVYFLVIAIFIAYRIISHLSATNSNIVEVLEGLTEELETKVEQRTALLEESIQNTESALAQAQNANQAKSRFLANMSHELRTPLNAILGFTQLMCRDVTIASEHQDNLKIINRSGEHLLKLINDILEMSKIEVGRITLNETKFDLYNMLDSLEQMLRLKIKAKNLTLDFNIDQNVPRWIYTDEGKLRQIMINLLGNALKFTEAGGITLTVKMQTVTARENQIDFLFSDTYSLYFAVQDTGLGIKPEEITKLFSPFAQTETGRTSNEGTGLGLSICHKFVELMGGELKVESTIGRGSTFYFDILVRQQDQIPEVNDLDLDEHRQIICLAPEQQKYRILVVDDVDPSRILLNKLLTTIGYEVREAANGLEAIKQWQEWQPHLILMDMRMPVMNGYEATRRIKSQSNHEQNHKTIVIALTASAFEEEKVKILSAGCDDFMRKPFQDRELLAKIGQYLKVEYIYEVESAESRTLVPVELTIDDLEVMSLKWRSQLYQAASRVDNQEIHDLIADIPAEYESLATSLENLVEDFRCDKIIDLVEYSG